MSYLIQALHQDLYPTIFQHNKEAHHFIIFTSTKSMVDFESPQFKNHFPKSSITMKFYERKEILFLLKKICQSTMKSSN
jgi:Fe2+ or Zn2+ uptake regulation protein